ncbi:stress response and cell division protein BolA [Ameyamaea chiangmaiensis NBRC 103196]|uniref:BolA family transcriptional regulator n=1 Tax=Ameyamaea chiangmaiensis TaxID=442969 RepID=A0A850PAL3_9PROT|nr:BolA family protein [Ameyamaea chiangmaiensis]MBS4073751.1 BolA family transcriptional regulator [Ameyamaea chiangmaiensis]NVN39983.1 BolA family transcriptional regulator [Ameyamaea chiangmaiensis]GBQ68588.1 stress response and cell division protein BolA [Ameyamaea chiangmaiensis NBRC 103196]
MTDLRRSDRMDETLRAAFAPEVLVIIDDSARHAGHAGAGPAGETHYDVTIVSARFEGMSRVARSRLVHEVLADEFTTGLHALALALRTPDEARRLTAAGAGA